MLRELSAHRFQPGNGRPLYDAGEADGQLHDMRLDLKRGLVVIGGARLAGFFQDIIPPGRISEMLAGMEGSERRP